MSELDFSRTLTPRPTPERLVEIRSVAPRMGCMSTRVVLELLAEIDALTGQVTDLRQTILHAPGTADREWEAWRMRVLAVAAPPGSAPHEA
jgi:hypothetical protein